MANEHDWLMIGSSVDPLTSIRVFRFRCKWCNMEDSAFDLDGPPVKRHMLDKCER